MSWAEMQKMGYARIICDTSTMTVGDTIRVKSVYNPTQYMDKQVVTVGTPVVFDLGFIKDYVKICMVQTINNVETEVGGVYKTLDYGQTIYVGIADFDKHSFAYVQSVLNNHQEVDLLSIGDEFPTKTVIGGTPIDWVMQVGHIDGSNHIVDFVSKYTSDTYFGSNYSYHLRTDLLNYLTTFYDNMRESDKRYVKTKTCSYMEATLRTIDQKVWIPSENEVFGNLPSENNTRLAIFTIQANRIKNAYSGGAVNWQLTSRNNHYGGYTDIVDVNGNDNYTASTCPALPCFRLTANV